MTETIDILWESLFIRKEIAERVEVAQKLYDEIFPKINGKTWSASELVNIGMIYAINAAEDYNDASRNPKEDGT